uniref:Putative RNA helicase SDE3 n=1 Tax=Davidia involucrata TaxID=16924 RepID=A0A5B6ZGX7_DAVIN
MSFFLSILRLIFGSDDEEVRRRSSSDDHEISFRNGNRNTNRQVPSYDTSPRLFPPTDTQTTAQICRQNYSTSTAPSSVQPRNISSNNNPIPSKLSDASPSPSPFGTSKPSQQGLSRNLSSFSSQSSSPSSSLKQPPAAPRCTKPTLSLAPSNLTNHHAKTNYIRVDEEGTSYPIYAIPEDIKALIEKDIVPGVLRKPLSSSTYKDYFDALLYADDYYLEKWDGFEMENVTLELHEAAIYRRKGKNKDLNKFDEKDDKVFVAFEIDSIPERRPFLLSRDFASARPSDRKAESFQGIIYRVVKSTLVLVEFGEDFHSQHYPARKYSVKFSFNRVCLKRAHQAIAAVSDSLFRNFLFPDCVPRNSLTITTSSQLSIDHKLDRVQVSAVRQILSLQGPPPYIVEGPLSVSTFSKQLSRTGMIVREAMLQIYRTFPSCRILICAPINSTCDVLMRSVKNEIRESDMFRANAAFRELDGVPDDILPSCLYKGECFSCPPLQELRRFKVICTTFMSSFRLHTEGMMAGHFSHIFLVDASSATEPEAMVALVNLANDKTSVVITGAPGNRSGLIHSKIARQNGLMISYFERLRESKLYKSLDPKFITQLEDRG